MFDSCNVLTICCDETFDILIIHQISSDKVIIKNVLKKKDIKYQI